MHNVFYRNIASAAVVLGTSEYVVSDDLLGGCMLLQYWNVCM